MVCILVKYKIVMFQSRFMVNAYAETIILQRRLPRRSRLQEVLFWHLEENNVNILTSS